MTTSRIHLRLGLQNLRGRRSVHQCLILRHRLMARRRLGLRRSLRLKQVPRTPRVWVRFASSQAGKCQELLVIYEV